MAARWTVNLLLALLLLGLGTSIRQVLIVADAPQTLTGLTPADLRLVAIERDGEPRIGLERTPDGWRVREPLDLDADQAQVERLLRILAIPVQRSFPAQSAALRELGLEPARLRLKLDHLTLGFGGLDPLGQYRYVAADGLVHLIQDSLYARLIAPPIDYYSRQPLPRTPAPVYATLKGAPLAAASLKTLAGLTAERVEPLTGELSGEPVRVKLADGTSLRFVVSEDRRHWSRLDVKLRYVLSDGLLLELDPGAVDPGPPDPPPVAPAPVAAPPPPAAPAPVAPPDAVTPQAAAPAPDAVAPDAVEAPSAAPPVVRLSPDRPAERRPGGPHPDRGEPGQGPATGFGAEPYKAPPVGFGVDPFAPDGAQDPSPANPGTGTKPGAGAKTPKAEITPSLRRH